MLKDSYNECQRPRKSSESVQPLSLLTLTVSTLVELKSHFPLSNLQSAEEVSISEKKQQTHFVVDPHLLLSLRTHHEFQSGTHSIEA